MRRDDEWTCPCGHEIDPTTKHCVVWDRKGVEHFVPDNSGVCTCHGTPLRVLEARGWATGV